MNHIQNRSFEQFENDVRQGKEYTKLEWNEFPYPESDGPLYQDVRYFGEFDCEQCGRWWMSGNSWFGFGQNCEGCYQMTYPWKLSELTGSDLGGVKEKPHSQARCERCKVLGYLCRNSEGVKLGNQKNAVSRVWTSKSKINYKSNTPTSMAFQTNGFGYSASHSYPTNRNNSSANSAQNPQFVYTNSSNRISNPNYANPSVSYSSMASRAVPKPVINRQQQQTIRQRTSSLLSSNRNSNESSNSSASNYHRLSNTNSVGRQHENFEYNFKPIFIFVFILFILFILCIIYLKFLK